MNRIVRFAMYLVLAGILGACSSSGPNITTASINDANPVVGQRVMLLVYAQTDNPPMQYTWHCDSGIFQSASGSVPQDTPTNLYYVYWIPTSADDASLSCTVSDSDDKEETVYFSATVIDREVDSLLAAPSVLMLMTKDYNAMSGGILAGVGDQNIRYYSATAETDFGWGEYIFPWGSNNALSAMAMYLYRSYYYSLTYVWAMYQDSTTHVWKLITHSTTDSISDCPFPSVEADADDGVSSVTKAILNGSTMWVGTDKGLYAYSTSGKTWTTAPVELATGVTTVRINDIYTFRGLLYVATDNGIYYTEDYGGTWKTFENVWDTKAITGYYDFVSTAITIYALTEETEGSATYTIKCFNNEGDLNATQPGLPADSYSWIESLDTDPLGNLWFGKWSWNAADGWQNPSAIDDSVASDNIVKSLVSPEGLVYLQTSSGVLKVWGKKPD